MKIESKAGPTILAPPTATANNSDARSRAIAKLNELNSSTTPTPTQQTHPVPNPNSISPEEFGAIRPTTNSVDGQTNTIDSSAEAATETPPTTADSKPPESTPPSEKPLSSQYALLARKEKALRAQQQKLIAEREAFKAEQAKLQQPTQHQIDMSKYVDLERLKQDPFGVLNENGVSYDQITNQALNQPSAEEMAVKRLERKVEHELKQLKEEQENVKKSYAEAQQQQYQQAVNQITSEIKSLVNSDDAYEVVRSTNSVKSVVDLIERTFEKEGYLMPIEEAAQAVEDYLVERMTKTAQLKKIQQRLQAAAKPPVEVTKPATQQSVVQQPQMKSLTNSLGTQRPMTPKERAVLAFQGKLK